MKYTEKEKARMLQSGRKGGFIRKRLPVVPQYIKALAPDKDKKILDFGCGQQAFTVRRFEDLGFKNTVGYDFPENCVDWSRTYDLKALEKKWDIIMLSNVINVQPSEGHAIELLTNITLNNLEDGGFLVFNYPASPRYSDIDFDAVSAAVFNLTNRKVELVPSKQSTLYRIDK